MNKYSEGMSIKFRMILLCLCLTGLMAVPVKAQKFSISTDVLDYACLGTLNADVSYAFARKWSLVAGARYNPFTFRKNDPQRQFQLRQQSYALGARFWPWHIWSGWWFAGKLRWQEYNYGGVISRRTTEGDRFGAGMYAGYTHMISPHFNVEFGLGLWAGSDVYSTYSCQTCGLTLDRGKRFFVLPDDVMISFAYVF